MRCRIGTFYQLDGEPFERPAYVEIMLTNGKLISSIRVSPEQARKMATHLLDIANQVALVSHAARTSKQ